MTASYPSPAFDWVREIKPDLKKLDAIPLTGAAPPFPWEDFSNRLSQVFEREGIAIIPGEIEWRSKETLFDGMGDAPLPLTVTLPTLAGEVCCVIPSQEIPLLAALLMTKETHPIPLKDGAFIESFIHFIAAEVLYQFTQVKFDDTLTPLLTPSKKLPSEDSLCKEISIQIGKHMTPARLIVSPKFRISWVDHFAQRAASNASQQPMNEYIPTRLHLEAGQTTLSLAEWKSIQLGDLLVLDSCSFEPNELSGRVLLTVNGKPSFRGKLKEGTLKILELPLLHEVNASMNDKHPENEEEFNDLDPSEEELQDPSIEEDDLYADIDDDLFNEEIENENISEEKADAPAEEEIPEDVEPAPQLTSPGQIPVNIVVEVGQIEMSMDQLLQLEPGNLLNVSLHPKNGVDLTINGKCVAKGELIRIGDVIGVRILQLGH